MKDFSFGIPLLRGKIEEKYGFGVFTLQALPTEKGKSYRMSLNQAGVEALGLDLESKDTISFSFDTSGDKVEVYVINSTNCEEI